MTTIEEENTPPKDTLLVDMYAILEKLLHHSQLLKVCRLGIFTLGL
jgi:hypothetical protein